MIYVFLYLLNQPKKGKSIKKQNTNLQNFTIALNIIVTIVHLATKAINYNTKICQTKLQHKNSGLFGSSEPLKIRQLLHERPNSSAN
jgi:hypothetical protein